MLQKISNFLFPTSDQKLFHRLKSVVVHLRLRIMMFDLWRVMIQFRRQSLLFGGHARLNPQPNYQI